jgi:hypothetical protein
LNQKGSRCDLDVTNEYLEGIAYYLEGINLNLEGPKCDVDYMAALIFYNATKNAVRSKVPKSETIYADLSTRFAKGKRETPAAQG